MNVFTSMIMHIFSWLFSICIKVGKPVREYDLLTYICKFIMCGPFRGKKKEQNE